MVRIITFFLVRPIFSIFEIHHIPNSRAYLYRSSFHDVYGQWTHINNLFALFQIFIYKSTFFPFKHTSNSLYIILYYRRTVCNNSSYSNFSFNKTNSADVYSIRKIINKQSNHTVFGNFPRPLLILYYIYKRTTVSDSNLTLYRTLMRSNNRNDASSMWLSGVVKKKSMYSKRPI